MAKRGDVVSIFRYLVEYGVSLSAQATHEKAALSVAEEIVRSDWPWAAPAVIVRRIADGEVIAAWSRLTDGKWARE